MLLSPDLVHIQKASPKKKEDPQESSKDIAPSQKELPNKSSKKESLLLQDLATGFSKEKKASKRDLATQTKNTQDASTDVLDDFVKVFISTSLHKFQVVFCCVVLNLLVYFQRYYFSDIWSYLAKIKLSRDDP